MSLLGKIFGKEDIIKKATEGIYNGIDASFFTDEEKANHFKELLKLYEPFKLAQRILSAILCVPYVSIWVLCCLMYMVGAFLDPCHTDLVCKSAQIQDASKHIAKLNNETLGIPVSLVVAFYFGGGALNSFIKK